MSPDAALGYVDAWIEERLEFYDPFSWGSPEERDIRRKAFGELSTYLCFKSWCGLAAPEKLDEFVIGIVNSAAYLGLACRRPGEFLLFAPAMCYPAQTGRLSDAALGAIRQMAAEPAVKAAERFPHRYLDYIFCHRAIFKGSPYDAALMRGIYDLSILSHRLVAASMTTQDAYALTHAVIYATNFGSDLRVFHERPELLPNVEDLDAVTCRYIFEENMDVALEFAACRMIASDTNSPTLAMCVDKAIDLLATMGHVPPQPKPQTEKDDNFTAAFRDWSEVYHTTMVLGFTLAIGLSQKRQFPGMPMDAEQLLRYGGLLSAASNADVFQSCVLAAELCATGMQKLPGAQFQVSAVERMLRRHIRLVQGDGDPGLLVDALRLGDLSGTSGTREGMESVNRLVRLVLPELDRFLTTGAPNNSAAQA